MAGVLYKIPNPNGMMRRVTSLRTRWPESVRLLFAVVLGALTVAGVACSPRPIVIAAAGDLYLGGRLPPEPLAGASEYLSGDLRLVNLEGALTARGAESGLDETGTPTGGPVRLRSEPARAAWLNGHLDVASIENNHALDQGEAGRADTIAALARHGVAAVAADRPLRLRRGHQLMTLLARHYPPSAELDGETELAAAVRAARTAGPVVVSVHWGHTGSLLPSAGQRALAHRLVEAGASAVLGHGPHSLQGVELWGGAVIAYSLGNLAFGCRCTSERDAYALRFRLHPDGSTSAVLLQPLRAGLQEAPAPSNDPQLFELIANLNADLGSGTEPVAPAGDSSTRPPTRGGLGIIKPRR